MTSTAHILAALRLLRFPDLMGRFKPADTRAAERHLVEALRRLREEQRDAWDARDIVHDMVDHACGDASRESIRAQIATGDVVELGDELDVRR